MGLRPGMPSSLPIPPTVPVRWLRGPPGPAGGRRPPSCPRGTLQGCPGQEQLQRGHPRGLPPQAGPAASLQGPQSGGARGPRDTAHHPGPRQGPEHQPQVGQRRVRPTLWLALSYLFMYARGPSGTCGRLGGQRSGPPTLHPASLSAPQCCFPFMSGAPSLGGGRREQQGPRGFSSVCKSMKINHL